jgi:hypothetical protein
MDNLTLMDPADFVEALMEIEALLACTEGNTVSIDKALARDLVLAALVLIQFGISDRKRDHGAAYRKENDPWAKALRLMEAFNERANEVPRQWPTN